MPILGILASQISGHLWAPSGAYDSIATTTVGSGGASTITFSSIPQTYTHLQIRAFAKTTDTYSGGIDNLTMSFNSDTTYTNYRSHYTYGSGAAANSGALQTNGFYAYVSDMPNSATGLTSIFGTAIIDILDYTNANKYKTVRSLNGMDENGSGRIFLMSALWMNTSAITSILLNPVTGPNFTQYSSFALYGIKS